jgi:cobalt/nickel transport system permease protein
MDLDRAVPTGSALHAADPRLKLVATLAGILAIGLLPVGAFLALAVVWVAIAGASILARLGPLRPSRGAFIALPFLLAAVPIIFTGGGETIGRVGPLDVSGPGLTLFATVALKSWLSVQVALLLAYTTPFHDLIDALRDLRLPDVLVAIVSFMYRYLAVLGDEARRMLRARASRQASAPVGSRLRSGGSLGWRARVTGQMVGSLFLRSYERSERIYAAMQARGFEGTFLHLAGRPISAGAWAALALLIAGLAGLVVTAHMALPRP